MFRITLLTFALAGFFSDPLFAQPTTKENVDKLRDPEVVGQLRDECRRDNERACQVVFLLKYISRMEVEFEKLEREWSGKLESSGDNFCRYLKANKELMEARFQLAVIERDTKEAEGLMRSVIRQEENLASQCSH